MFAGHPGKADDASVPKPDKKEEPPASSTAQPQTFSAAKLMMPPVRKKAEPAPGKKPLPALDIAKLQAEKEALMRQRTAAAAKESEKPSTPTAASSTSAPTFL